MAANTNIKQDLIVKGETIERLYISYADNKYIVNRRYQRKLVWSMDEKRAFIDSIVKKYPVPIILLAEDIKSESIEIIDGMQRMNSIFSFIEGDFSIDGKYFDLESMASTKELADNGALEQKHPKLPRSECVRITAYTVPVSVFEYSADSDVDETFRRINSGGRKLSRQDLRAAGSLEDFATATRVISSNIRGDVSHSDTLPLNKMKSISIASKDLGYGIDVDNVFWVAQGILSKEDVRQSTDEKTIAEMISYVIYPPSEKPGSRSEYLDDYFGMNSSDASIRRFNEVNLKTRTISIEILKENFLKVLDVIQACSKQANLPLTSILFGPIAQPKAPRVFQIVFLAIYEIMIEKNMSVKSISALVEKMKKGGPKIEPQEGGNWGAENKKAQIEKFKKQIIKEFYINDGDDPAEHYWDSKLRNLITQSHTEQASYDFKQGLLALSGNKKFNDDALEKILKTCTGIANIKRNQRGYVLLGISDRIETAKKINDVYGANFINEGSFYVHGIDHEAQALSKTHDDYFYFITEKIRKSKLSDPLKSSILREIKYIKFKEKSILVIEVLAQEEPSLYDEKYYIREGSSLRELKPSEHINLFKRFVSA